MTETRDELMDDVDSGVALQSVFRTLWSYRRTMLLAFAITATACIVAVVFLYAWTPSERITSFTFQATFAGAERDEYPNGTKFTGADIVASPVLTEVFRANDLERYMRFSDFKESMFVLQTNRDLELLSFEYQTKLSDTRLTVVDRARLEDEFRTKAASLRSAQYSVNLRRSERLRQLPSPLTEKVLQDTLSTWAKQAADSKGAVRYDIAIISKNALKRDLVEADDYIIAVDLLRTKIELLLRTISRIEEIPGAAAVRMGDERVTLADVRVTLDDLLRFKVEPLLYVIGARGLSRNPDGTSRYFEGRLLEVQLAHTEASQRLKAKQEALRNYAQPRTAETPQPTEGRTPAITPQLSESFIDRIVQLSTQSVDVEYRQELTKEIIEDGLVLAELSRQVSYYESMRKGYSSTGASATPSADADVSRRMNQSFDALSRSMDQVQAIFDLISKQNLNPDNVVYSITSPLTTRTSSGLSLRKTVLNVFVTLFIAIIVIPLACLGHDYFRNWISPIRRATIPPTLPPVRPGRDAGA